LHPKIQGSETLTKDVLKRSQDQNQMVKLKRLLQESFFELEPKNIQAKTGRFLKISQKTAHFKKGH
jgi:hypothetical protein